jgi:hypothetical protein
VTSVAGQGMVAGMMRALWITALAGVVLGLLLLFLAGCETMEVTGRVYLEDSGGSGAKGGVVLEPGGCPGWWVRVPMPKTGAEFSGPLPVVVPEK